MGELFKSFWHLNPLSAYERLCLKSFIDHGHRFALYSYERHDVPAGVEICDAAEILPQDRFFTYSSGPGLGSPAAFSNVFRYALLSKKGGWWADTDVVCMTDTVPMTDYVFAYQDADVIASGILKAPENSSLMRDLFAEADRLGTNVRWGEAGPSLVTRIVKQQGLEHHCLPTEKLYPIHFTEAVKALNPAETEGLRARIDGADFYHLWNEMFRRAGIRKDHAPPEGSLLDDLFKKHGITVDFSA